MSETSPLLRLPREVRDLIYDFVLDTAAQDWLYPRLVVNSDWKYDFPYYSRIGPYDTKANYLSHNFPALCCVSRQLFLESSLKFIEPRTVYTYNVQTMKWLHEWLEQFPNSEGFAAISGYSCEEWDVHNEEANVLQHRFLTRMKNLEYVRVVFEVPTLEDGVALDDYEWYEEQNCMSDFGFSHPDRCFYTQSLRGKWRLDKEDIKQEKMRLNDELHSFIDRLHLAAVLDLSKLKFLEFEFVARDGGKMRHNLCNVLCKWFDKEFAKRSMDVSVTTGYSEV